MIFFEAVDLAGVAEEFSGVFNALNSSVFNERLSRLGNQCNTSIAEAGGTVNCYTTANTMTDKDESADAELLPDSSKVVFRFLRYEIQ